MKRFKLHVTAIVVLLLALGAGSYAIAGDGNRSNINENLIGYQEVPSISTVATGRFTARISNDNSQIDYSLSYRGLEGAVQQAHIHFGQRSVNGGISVFLCTNLGNGPAGTQACPASPATITGTIRANDVIGPIAPPPPGGQGIEPGAFDELLAAIRAGVTYANVHSTKWPGGEIRAQLLDDRKGRGDDDEDEEDDD
jgi:CHRD domain